jgi:hypothetical protein
MSRRAVLVECFPLKTAWPKTETPVSRQKHAPFKVGYDAMWDDLERELDMTNARSIHCEFDMDRSQFRKLDTRPFATAARRSPKVLLSFEKGDMGRLYFPCDSYSTWSGNLRAISLTLTALRSIDRYGATAGEQYKGFRRLGSGGPRPGDNGAIPEDPASVLATWELTATPLEAAEVLVDQDPASNVHSPSTKAALAATMVAMPSVAKTVALAALKATHPDTGGDPTAFHRVQAARRRLALAHGEPVPA